MQLRKFENDAISTLHTSIFLNLLYPVLDQMGLEVPADKRAELSSVNIKGSAHPSCALPDSAKV